jgi:hypothetical protein
MLKETVDEMLNCTWHLIFIASRVCIVTALAGGIWA